MKKTKKNFICFHPKPCLNCKKYKRVLLGDAEHPTRQKAIAILEMLIGAGVFKKEPKNELWYQLEDAITEIIAKK